MYFVTFCKKQSARTGNILFQYLFCKRISISLGHIYIPIEDKHTIQDITEENTIYIHDSNAEEILSMPECNKHIVCDGFFQQSDFYIPFREQLLNELYKNDDYWYGFYGNKEYIRDFLYSTHEVSLENNDIVISLRLDDFIQLPCPTSDILPPTYYINILENKMFSKLYIVCDKIKQEWETRYLEFFSKWSPILVQGTLSQDCALMRDARTLIHSNSTLCWIMSFFASHKKERYIPRTHFYSGQCLKIIDPYTDVLENVRPMSHSDVYNIHYHQYLKSTIYPLSYCIPDECIVNTTDVLSKKNKEIAGLVPGERNSYIFDSTQETEYNEMYQCSLFAHTKKKGGWDCLRHYEIMANGCIPLFNGLDNCPPDTLTTLPKDVIIEANRRLLPWNYNNKPLYDEYVSRILNHCREHCSTSSTISYFLNKMGNITPKNLLLIMGNIGVNYSRETFWIGMKRYIQSVGGVAVEYPKIDFLYKTYNGDKKNLYGNGFTYAMRLDDDYNFIDSEIVEKIQNKFFDLIIYGKVGPDELYEGSHPNMPLWEHVFKRYSKDQIVYIYGGDECIDLRTNNKYSQHIINHSRFARCFVRELIF